MKRKGFTLIELLGVIIILAILSVLVSQIIINRVREINNDMEKSAKNIIISSAREYVEDNSTLYIRTNNASYCISYNTLINSSVLNEEMIPNIDSISYLKDWYVKATFNGELFDYEMLQDCE